MKWKRRTGDGFPEEDIKERREAKDGMSTGTDTGINIGMNGILEAALLQYNTGILEKRTIIMEDRKTTGLNWISRGEKRARAHREDKNGTRSQQRTTNIGREDKEVGLMKHGMRG